MASETNVRLVAGNLRIELSPSIGGSISAFEWTGDNCVQPILRKCNSAFENVLDAASFPLVPYVNRIRGGTFTFRGREIRLAPNMAGDPSPLHGQGWLNAWQVEEATETRAVLCYRHQAGEWPWAYDARQEFALDEGGFSVTLACRNVSDEPMPCGLGQHPYFPCGSETRIDTHVAVVWTIDEHVLPVEKIPAKGRFDLRQRAVCGQDLDNGFGGWNGVAVIYEDGPGMGQIVIRAPDAKFFQLYSPKEGGIFVAEPVSHANAALNAPEDEWEELGIRVLEPGETMNLDMRLEVIPK